MAFREYRDFIIVGDNVRKDHSGIVSRFRVSVFDSPAGQGEKHETVGVPAGFTEQLRRLEGRGLDEKPDRQMDIGEKLAGLLLPVHARDLYNRSLARLRADEGLRLRLRLADELADFPWEYMYIAPGHGERTSLGFLALNNRISIARHEAVAAPDEWSEVPAPQFVVAMATPQPHRDYPKLSSLPKEQADIKDALRQVPGVQPVYKPDYGGHTVDDIHGATRQDVLDALTERTNVFHFGGHGEFTADMGPAFGSKIGRGGIVLADEKNQADPLAADRLAEMLQSKGIRLVVLGACETGRRDGHNVWSGVAAALLQARIPAVVAMQYKIKDDRAAAFSRQFYGALVSGLTIDEAVALGRAAIRNECRGSQRDARDWGVPVLYLRTKNAVLFPKAAGVREPADVVARPVPGVTTSYDRAAIRELIEDSYLYDDEGLTALCFEEFPEVRRQFTSGMSMPARIQRLLEYVWREERVPDLLAIIQERKPAKHAKFEARLKKPAGS